MTTPAGAEIVAALQSRFGPRVATTDPDLLAFLPRPIMALLLVFPLSAAYESQRMAEDALAEDYKGKGKGEPVMWFKQTIRNACGLMGLLHAVSNGEARQHIRMYHYQNGYSRIGDISNRRENETDS